MRAISSGACPVDRRFGLTLGLAISRQARRARPRDTARRVRAGEAGRRAGGARPRAAGPSDRLGRSSGTRRPLRRPSRRRASRPVGRALGPALAPAAAAARSYRSRCSGSGTTSGPGAARNASSASNCALSKTPVASEMRSISSRNPSRSMRLAGSSNVSLANMITKRAATPGSLAAQDAAHPLDHLAPGAARAHDDPEVRVGYVDAFVEHAGAATASSLRTRRSSRISRR